MLVAPCLGAFACFVSAGAIGAGQWVLSQRNLSALEPTESQAGGASNPEIVVPGQRRPRRAAGTSPPTVAPATTVPLVLAEPEAANFLVVGADNNDCSDSPITEDRSDIGERSDTIMVWRANPDTNQLAVLSFPRDLYVEYPSGRKDRINAAFRRNDPTLLQEVINFNFGIQIDHYIQIDFCAFRRLVNAVGGVGIPFEYPARDQPERRHHRCSSSSRPGASTSTATPRSRTCAAGTTSTKTRPAAATGSPTRRPTSGGSGASRTSCGGCSPR